MHAPRPITPLSFDLVIETLAEGFTKAQAEYDCPIMVTPKEINHYVYVSFHPIPDEAVIADRMTRYHDELAEKVPTVGKTWEEQWKPDVIAEERPGEDRRLLGPQRRRAGRQARRVHRPHALPVVDPRPHQLRAPVEQRVLRPLRQGDAARGDDRGVPDAAGLPHPLGRRQPGVWELSRIVKDSPTLSKLFAEKPSTEIVAEPSTRPTRVEAFRRAARRVPRSSSAGAATPSTTSPTSRGGRTGRSRWPASPASWTSTTARIPSCCTSRRSASARSCWPRPGRSWPTIPTRWRSSTSSTRPPATASRSPRTTPSTSTSSASACSAASCWPSATGSCRRASSTSADDVFFLYRDEVRRGAAPTAATGAPIVAERRASFEAGRQGGPARRGRHAADAARASPDPFMDALVFRLLGMVPPEENPDPNVLQGVAGSPGVVHRRRPGSCARSPRRRTSRRARSWCAR